MTNDQIWAVIGVAGQLIFGLRLAIQWIKSEQRKEVVIPIGFWYLSLVGGIILLAYAIHLQSVPFILGQSFGLVVYSRNLYLIRRAKKIAVFAKASDEGKD